MNEAETRAEHINPALAAEGRRIELLDEDEVAALEGALTLHPEAGAVIPGTGGVR